MTRRLILLVGVALATATAQTAALSGDQQAWERYRTWISGQPLSVRGFSEPELMKLYRAYLKERGFKEAEITSQIELLRQHSQQLDAEHWNQYFTAEHPTFNTSPNAFLVEMIKGRAPGKALDVAMGQGRNSLWLAQRGWDVTGFDIADKAIAAANEQAAKVGVKIHTELNTIEAFDYGQDQWDLILLSYAGGGPSPDRVEAALKPGGILIVEAFHDDALKTLRVGGSLFKTGALPARYPGLRTVRYEEPIAMPDFAQKQVRVVRFCAQKPTD